MKNVVFYSKLETDPHSSVLLSILEKMPFAGQLCYYCVNPKKINKDLLTILEINDLPTMYIDGVKLVGNEAFEWLREQVQKMGGERERQRPPQTVTREQPPPARPSYYDEEPDERYMSSAPPPRSQHGLPGMPQVPHMGGFAGNEARMAPPSGGGMMRHGTGSGGPIIGSEDDGGMGLAGGSGASDSNFANPLEPVDITGISRMSQEELVRSITNPIEHKEDESAMMNRTNQMLEQYTRERESMVPEAPMLPGMGMRRM